MLLEELSTKLEEIWFVDFEFTQPDGERPDPICLVALELKSGKLIRLWRDEFGPEPPYPLGKNSLFIAYAASAELGCHRELGWGMPARVLDLYFEFRALMNGRPKPLGGYGLLAALTYFGLDSISVVEKKEMRDRAIRGGPWLDEEREPMLDYCQTDVDALPQLLAKMAPHISLPHAIHRGRYAAAVSAMERTGIPTDTETLDQLRNGGWEHIKGQLVSDIDADYGVFEGLTFKHDRWRDYLIREGIPWPQLESGKLDLSDDTFKEMERGYPQVSPIRALRSSLSKLRLVGLTMGEDGRNRYAIMPFASITGRNQPSNAKSIFGPDVWMRWLIRAPPGHAIAYVDWSQQEFAIAAVLSGDKAMIAAYMSGDPYLEFAKQAGLAPPDATKESHEKVRDYCKTCVLGIQYGMGEYTLAQRTGLPLIAARELLKAHRRAYPKFWRWSDAALDHALLLNYLPTIFDWRVHVGGEGANPRSLRNYPMQANGSEMMRLAACLATERGIEVCAPVHDAFLICAPIDKIDEEVARMQACMAEASRAVLGGFELRTDVKIFPYPYRYRDKRGREMWRKVRRLLKPLPRKEKRKVA